MAKQRNAAGAHGSGLLERPLTARSVLASLLLGMHPPRLAGARLVRWCGVFGIAEGTARVALSRMVDRGELAATDGVYELAGPVRARQRVQEWSLDPDAGDWDGRGAWAPSSAPPAMRPTGPGSATRCGGCGTPKRAKASGCGPTNLPRASGPDDAWEVADAQCEWWTARPERDPRELATELFDPDAWAARASALLAALTRATDSLAAPTDADLAHAFEAGAAVLTHLRADPLLPVALCPAPWPGDRLRAAYAEYQHAFGAAVREWFRAGA